LGRPAAATRGVGIAGGSDWFLRARSCPCLHTHCTLDMAARLRACPGAASATVVMHPLVTPTRLRRPIGGPAAGAVMCTSWLSARASAVDSYRRFARGPAGFGGALPDRLWCFLAFTPPAAGRWRHHARGPWFPACRSSASMLGAPRGGSTFGAAAYPQAWPSPSFWAALAGPPAFPSARCRSPPRAWPCMAFTPMSLWRLLAAAPGRSAWCSPHPPSRLRGVCLRWPPHSSGQLLLFRRSPARCGRSVGLPVLTAGARGAARHLARAMATWLFFPSTNSGAP